MKAPLKFISLMLLLIVGGCGGAASKSTAENNNPSVIYTVLNGIAYAGTNYSSGFVNVYNYSDGTKGVVLKSESLNSNGTFSLSVPNIPSAVLVEVTGCYTEKVISWLATNNGSPSAALGASYCNSLPLIAAIVVPSNLSTFYISVTPFTHAATGLAAYKIKNGVSVANAINDANLQFSNWVGADIIKTVPFEPSGDTTFSASSLYGAMISAIPSWIFNVATPSPSVPPYTTTLPSDVLNTVTFADSMRMDLVKDGILNGFGINTNNNSVTLSMGSSALNTEVYRHQLALYATFRIRGETEGYRSSNGASYIYASEDQKQRIIAFLPSLVAFNSFTDVMFENIPVVPLNYGQPEISLYNNSGAAYTGDMPITGLIHDNVGVYGNYAGGYVNSSGIFITDGRDSNIRILVDGVYSRAISPAVYYTDSIYNLNAWINTTLYSNGPHVVTLSVKDNLGSVTSVSINANFVN